MVFHFGGNYSFNIAQQSVDTQPEPVGPGSGKNVEISVKYIKMMDLLSVQGNFLYSARVFIQCDVDYSYCLCQKRHTETKSWVAGWHCPSPRGPGLISHVDKASVLLS